MPNGTHWRDMLSQQGHGGRQLGGEAPTPTPTLAAIEPERDEALELDLAEYRPWVLQRGRSRPAALLDLRWYDARAGLWLGCAIAYPQLAAAEYIGDGMVSLDFGKRQFVLEGDGLGELVRRIQDGSVIRIQEYAAAIWPRRPVGAIINRIKRLGAAMEGPPPR
ncbi:hypothetical protein [Sphingopyxis sp. GC21]|uniref:hypothetical protein n=1 Tax=Sphingopyxis sp. GC21 TaxID=2933562 RepID=UPI0021E36DBB|nr:hypothetical protein [Sphingopyxis sp. GC21]